MTSSRDVCDTSDLPRYTSWTKWSNCTLGDCFQQSAYRLQYESWCSDELDLDSTSSVDRGCCASTRNIETQQCEGGLWNCTRTDRSDFQANDPGLVTWTSWRAGEPPCISDLQNISQKYRIGWRVKYSDFMQPVNFFEEKGPGDSCAVDQPEEQGSNVWIYYLAGILFFALVCVFIVVITILHRRYKLKKSSRDRLAASARQRRQDWMARLAANILPPAYMPRTSVSPTVDTECGGGSGGSATLRSTTISTISLPPTYDEAILSDDEHFVAVPRTTTTTITRTETSALSPISLSAANAIITGIPPPSYEMVFHTGLLPDRSLENERPPPYTFARGLAMSSVDVLY